MILKSGLGILLLMGVLIFIIGCSKSEESYVLNNENMETPNNSAIMTQMTSQNMDSNAENIKAEYHKISPKEAKDIMEKEHILVDARSDGEFFEGHIPGAIVIPHNEIAKRAEKELLDKNATILVYCRSGARSAYAAKELVKQGYTQVYDIGGITSWPYEIEKGAAL